VKEISWQMSRCSVGRTVLHSGTTEFLRCNENAQLQHDCSVVHAIRGVKLAKVGAVLD
jgi:hypothetical protein